MCIDISHFAKYSGSEGSLTEVMLNWTEIRVRIEVCSLCACVCTFYLTVSMPSTCTYICT